MAGETKYINNKTGEVYEEMPKGFRVASNDEIELYHTDNPVLLNEIEVTYNPSTNNRPFYKSQLFLSVFGSGNPVWGLDRTNINRRAWQRNPQAMLNWVDGQNVATILTLPYAAHTVSTLYSVPEIAGFLNLTGAYEGINKLTSKDGVTKTINKFSNREWSDGFKSLGGDAFDVAISLPFLNKVRLGINHIANTTNKIHRMETWYNGRKWGQEDRNNIWLSSDKDVSRDYGEDVRKILVDPKHLKTFETPKSTLVSEWNDMPFEINEGELLPSKAHIPTTRQVLLKDGEFGEATFNSRPLPKEVNDPIQYMNENNISHISTDDIVDLANSRGYNSTRLYNVADGNATDGVKLWFLPIDELIIQKEVPHYTIGQNLSRWRLFPHLLLE